jgi:omega-amidase
MGGEDNHFSEGSEKLIVNYKNWKINFLICYDLRFPVWAKNNFASDTYDYDVLIVVANWPAVRSRVWETLLSARAIENQSYVIGVNRVGADGNGLAHSGNSNIIDPKGVPLIEQATDMDFTKTLLISRFDLVDFRNKFKVGLDWDDFAINQEPKNIKSGEKYSTKNIQKEYNG